MANEVNDMIPRTDAPQSGVPESDIISQVGVEVKPVPAAVMAQVPELKIQAALAALPESDRQEVIALSESIDVRKIDNVMKYGATVLRKTFDQCGDFLKSERGSAADQEVIKQVIALSKKASESYDDFSLELQEPGLFQKIFLAFIGKGKGSRIKKMEEKATTSFNLLVQLKESSESWEDMLKKSMGDTEYAALGDIENVQLLEKYIIAGRLAEERIAGELQAAQDKQQETGLQLYDQDIDLVGRGLDIFRITLNNLEKSRVAYKLSIGQLNLIARSNLNVQVAINTQVENSMTLIGQQLRNALLDAKNREVMEGQKALIRLNDELLMEVSKSVGLTAQESEELKYKGFYNTEAAKQAVTTVISTCQSIQKVASDMLPKMQADMTELNRLIGELEPYVHSPVEAVKTESTKPTTGGGTTGTGKLQF